MAEREKWQPAIQETRLRLEPGIGAGPTSSRIAVVDYNADENACVLLASDTPVRASCCSNR